MLHPPASIGEAVDHNAVIMLSRQATGNWPQLTEPVILLDELGPLVGVGAQISMAPLQPAATEFAM